MNRSPGFRLGAASIVLITAILVLSVTATLIAKSHSHRVKQHQLAQWQAQAFQMSDAIHRLLTLVPATKDNNELQILTWDLTPRESIGEKWVVNVQPISDRQVQLTATIRRGDRILVTFTHSISIALPPVEADPS